jgi:hypothetical protein
MKYVLLLIIALSYNISFAQECNFEKDTLYLLFVGATPVNDIPQSICCLAKDINTIKISSDGWRAFVDTLFTSVVYSEYIFLGFSDKMDCYKDSSEYFFDKIIGDFITYMKKLGKFEKYILKKGMLKDSSTVTISIVKIAGEFWKVTDMENINTITHQIYVNLDTYGYSYYYIFKKINDLICIPETEIVSLQEKFTKAGIKFKHFRNKRHRICR